MYKLSVIIPVYNVERYIERCAVSLFEQTLQDVEFIFINDKTPDCSMEILKNICKRYSFLKSNIKLLEHERNFGLATTRITGIKAAQGTYIAFCDSDDWVETSMYEKMYDRAVETDSDVTYCNYYVEYKSKTVQSSLRAEATKEGYLLSLLNGILPNFSCIRIYKRNLLLNNLTELYKPDINMWEDVLMNMTLALHYVHTVSFTPFVGYHYNQCNENAYTQVRSDKSLSNMVEVTNIITSRSAEIKNIIFPLITFRLNARYSIASHCSLERLKSFNWPYPGDDAFIWKIPYMPLTNRLFLFFLHYRMYKVAYDFLKSIRSIKNFILPK